LKKTYTATDIEVLSEIEHVLKKPGMWVGSIHDEKRICWGIENGKMKSLEIKTNPAMHKIYREVLDNAIDELILSQKKNPRIEIEMLPNNGIRINDNGRGIPIERHPKERKWVPELVMTQLRSGRNFGDTDQQTIGTYGVGVSLTNILASKLEIKIARDGKSYTQIFENNSKNKTDPKIKKISKHSYTEITFIPDIKIFGQSKYSLELIRRELIDLSYMFSNITFILKSGTGPAEKIRGKSFADYMGNFSESNVFTEDKNAKVGLYLRDVVDLDQISMVNGAFTVGGGSHINYILTWINKLRPLIERRIKYKIKPNDIKNCLGVVCFLSMKTPEFDSQTKSRLISPDSEISKFLDVLSDKFLRKFTKSSVFAGLLDALIIRCESKEKLIMRKSHKALKKIKVAKLIDCHSNNRKECTLFITEGESARGYLSAVSDRNVIASLPLKGKVLNCHSIKATKLLANEEIKSLLTSCGLEVGNPDISDLRYGKIVIATDVDQDGNAILSLLINFFFKFWPDLFKENIITRFITPLYSVIKSNKKKYYYSKKEFNTSGTGGDATYFKGLGSMSKDDWDYAINKNPKYINIDLDDYSQDNLDLAFSSDVEKRKKWLT